MPERLRVREPVSYHEMLVLERNARAIVTDSGGVQKEAFFFKVPTIIPRSETEWVEIANAGKAILTGPNEERIMEAVEKCWRNFPDVTNSSPPDKVAEGKPEAVEKVCRDEWPPFYGDGNAARKMCAIISDHLKKK
jgi:UDP-N-acetylglucosamine 2-epimerase